MLRITWYGADMLRITWYGVPALLKRLATSFGRLDDTW